MNKMLEISALEMAGKIRQKEISSKELIGLHLTQIAKFQGQVNAIEQINDHALEEAFVKDEELKRHKIIGPLHGVPISVKDSMYVQGFRSSLGSRSLLGEPAQHSATIINRLKQAGAIVLAMTNVPELLAGFDTENALYGRTNNPHDLKRTAGGTSGGEAALISICGSPLGIASDGSGSIRVPAHNCGIVGFKPSQALLPATGGYPMNSTGLLFRHLTFGLMSRHVKDIPHILDIISGPDGYDPYIAPISFNALPNNFDLKTIRVGYLIDNGVSSPDKDTLDTLRAVLDECEIMGIKIQEIPNNLHQKAHDIFYSIYFNNEQAKMLKNIPREGELSNQTEELLKTMQEHKIDVVSLRNLLADLDTWRFKMMESLQEYDIILSPVASTPAKLHGESIKNMKDFSYVIPPSLLGGPAISLPCGVSRDRLPIGIQIFSKPWRDKECLCFAAWLEQTFGGWIKPGLIS